MSAKPFVTYYDDATGERIELSYDTFENWVAKTANLLVDGLGVTAGDTVAVRLPVHWQAAVVAFAVWRVGATIGDSGAAVAFADEPSLGAVSAPEVVGLSLDAFGRRLAAAPPGVTDYAAEVAAYGDRFDRQLPAVPTPYGAEDRIALAPEGGAGWLDTVRQVHAAGASIVLVRNPDPATWANKLATERVTVGRGS